MHLKKNKKNNTKKVIASVTQEENISRDSEKTGDRML